MSTIFEYVPTIMYFFAITNGSGRHGWPAGFTPPVMVKGEDPNPSNEEYYSTPDPYNTPESVQ
jgi:hypothetical protein